MATIALGGLTLFLTVLKIYKDGVEKIKPFDIIKYGFVSLCGFLYGVIMSVIFCNIEIKADKDIYDSNDKAYILINAKGYVFNPFIKQVQFNFHVVASDTSRIINGVVLDFSKFDNQASFGQPYRAFL